MNWLYEGLPDAITVDGRPYPIITDFREWLKFLDMLSSDMPENIRTRLIMEYFTEERPKNAAGAIQALFEFVTCGKQAKSAGGDAVYDMEQDCEYIYSGFVQQYGIDLTEVRGLHWWKFKALLNGLRDCKLTDIINVRTSDLDDYKDAKARSTMRRLKEMYALKGADRADADEVFGMFG